MNEPIVHKVEKEKEGELFKLLKLARKTVAVLHNKAGDECKYTLFTSPNGTQCNVSKRVADILRDQLRLGANASSTSIRRAVADFWNGKEGVTEQEKNSAS